MRTTRATKKLLRHLNGRHHRISVRSKLILIVAVSLIPSVALAVLAGVRLSAASRDLAKAEITRIADSAAAQQRLLVQAAEQMLRTIAASEDLHQGDPRKLHRLFSRLLSNNSQYATIVATSPRGEVIASGLNVQNYSLSDRAYIQEAVTSKHLIIGPWGISRSTGIPIVPLAYPVLDARDNVQYVLVAGLKTTAIAANLAGIRPSEGSIWELLDRDGRRIFRIPYSPQFNYGSPADPGLMAILSTVGDSVTASGEYAHHAVFLRSAPILFESDTAPSFRILLAVPSTYSPEAGRIDLAFYFGIGLLSLLGSLFLALLSYRVSIGKRLNAIVGAAAAIGELDRDKHLAFNGEDEFDLLSRILRKSSLSLQRRQREQEEAQAAIESSLREKEILLKEIHHRVKNNFQIISSLLSLQEMSITDEAVLRIFEESRNRIQSMALIHERLYRSEDFSSIDFGEYTRQMVDHLTTTYQDCASRVSIGINAPKSPVPLEIAVPLGLILNELLSNSFKHAFVDGRAGRILIELEAMDSGVGQLIVTDDGIGLPEILEPTHEASLGLELVSSLTEQLHGSMHGESPVENSDRGTRFMVSFPL